MEFITLPYLNCYTVSFTQEEAGRMEWFANTCPCGVGDAIKGLLVKAIETIGAEMDRKDTKPLFDDFPIPPIYDVKFELPAYLGDLKLNDADKAFITATLQMSLRESVAIVTYKKSLKETHNVLERSHEDDGSGKPVVP
jgi:hypothetical protein